MRKRATLVQSELHRTYLTFDNAVAVAPKGKGKGKVKVLPRTGHEGPEGKQMYSTTLS